MSAIFQNITTRNKALVLQNFLNRVPEQLQTMLTTGESLSKRSEAIYKSKSFFFFIHLFLSFFLPSFLPFSLSFLRWHGEKQV
jgi:hypothetical protein